MKFEDIFKYSAVALKAALYEELFKAGYCKELIHNKTKFLYAEGNAPYMLVAHLDTVHEHVPSVICYSKDGNYIMSPYGIGGDDRCGVFIIMSLLKKLPFQPYVVFTMEEETGGQGASAFVKYIKSNGCAPTLKYIVEYDRKGNKDCVFYNCDNKDFVKFVEAFGFKKAYGTFSDISIIAPQLGVAAVNLSSGYYNPHTKNEYVCMKDMCNIINSSAKMLTAACKEFKYIKSSYSYSGRTSTYTEYTRSYARKASVSFLPANVVKVYDYYAEGKYRSNYEHEIAVDETGLLYRYNDNFDDLVSLHYNVPVPIGEYTPIYNKVTAVELNVYF